MATKIVIVDISFEHPGLFFRKVGYSVCDVHSQMFQTELFLTTRYLYQRSRDFNWSLIAPSPTQSYTKARNLVRMFNHINRGGYYIYHLL
jgi:hypothetical protein